MSSNLWEEDGEALQGRCRNVLYLPWMVVLWLGPLSKHLQAVHERHVSLLVYYTSNRIPEMY